MNSLRLLFCGILSHLVIFLHVSFSKPSFFHHQEFFVIYSFLGTLFLYSFPMILWVLFLMIHHGSSIFSLLLLSSLIKLVKFIFQHLIFLSFFLSMSCSYFCLRTVFLWIRIPIRGLRSDPKSAPEYAATLLILFWCLLFINIVDLITNHLLSSCYLVTIFTYAVCGRS